MKNPVITFALIISSLSLTPALQAQNYPEQNSTVELIEELENDSFAIQVKSIDSVLIYKGTLSSLEPRVRDGEFEFYYPSGKLYASGSYKDNNPTGAWVFYNTNMQIAQRINYDDARTLMSDTLAVSPCNDLYTNKLKKETKDISTEGFFQIVDVMPSFNNDIRGIAFMTYCDSAMVVPAYTRVMDVPWYVTVQFIIDYQGKLRHPRVTQSGGPDLTCEILRALAQMPDWEPAKLKNIPVSSGMKYTFLFKTGFPEFTKEQIVPATPGPEEKTSPAPKDFIGLADEAEEPGYIPEVGDVFFIVEQMPTFNGGDPAVEFRKYIARNLRYPEKAASFGISGRVIVQFTVYPDGIVRDATVVKSADPNLNAEAIRVVSSSPPWEPGMQRGKKVAVLFTYPISFQIQA